MKNLSLISRRLFSSVRSFACEHRAFLGILAATTVLYFFIISRISVAGDASHYAFRALGWLDWFTGQEGPAKIVGHHEWWMDLSFQDHPPAVFFIQHWFLKILGESSFVALLPSAVAGICTLIIMYWSISRLQSAQAALWATLLLATDTYAVHMFTDGFHEGVESVFIVASFFLLLFYIERKNVWYLYTSACALGLSILSKYTAVFGAAGFGVVLLSDAGLQISFKRIFGQKRQLFFVLLLLTITLSPVIIYNLELFRAANQFDSAFASMIGAQNVFGTKPSLNVPGNIISTIYTQIISDFPLYAFAAFTAFLWLLLKYLREETTTFERGLFFYSAFLFLMFAFMGGAERHQPIFQPFLAMCLAVGITDMRQRFGSKVIDAALLVFFVLGLAYCLNTHVFPNPIGWHKVTYSEQRGHDFGLNELDRHIRNIAGPLPALERPQTISEIFALGLPTIAPSDAQKIIIFDARFEFFALWWQLERYTMYHQVSLYPTSAPISGRLLGGGSFDRSVLPRPDTPVYYIYVTNKKFMDPHVARASWPDMLSQLLDMNNFPYESIHDLNGVPMFRIYKLNP